MSIAKEILDCKKKDMEQKIKKSSLLLTSGHIEKKSDTVPKRKIRTKGISSL